MNLKDLGNKFHPEDLEWRIQQSGTKVGRPWALVLAYVTNRAIMDRLDEVVGIENWQNVFKEAPAGGVLCGISIRVPRDDDAWQEWITKWDGAENTEIESIKGGLSGSMKRASVQWGIGRYLYNLPTGWAVINDKGRFKGKASVGGGQPVWFKWDPPALPDWAFPGSEVKEEKSAKIIDPEMEMPKEQYGDIPEFVEPVKGTVKGLKATLSEKMGSMSKEEKKAFFAYILSERKATVDLLQNFVDNYQDYADEYSKYVNKRKEQEGNYYEGKNR